ncbi:MAG: pentapeptide repeat-containing protein [Alphaproteobacteria bacterium GM202ARS2]|nr:pentapeptide repeat-containing protein [Alphaproteobacteria bacterium GM202ARS2]
MWWYLRVAVVLVAVAVALLFYGNSFVNWAKSIDGLVFERISKILLILGGLIGIGLATWRNIASQKQVEIARKTQASDQWTRAMDLLTRVDSEDKPLIDARIGGLNSLGALADADPEGYGVRAMQNMISYIKVNAQKTAVDYPNEPEKRATQSFLGEDVKISFRLLGRIYNSKEIRALRRQGRLKRFFDKGQKYDDLDFSGADFRYLNFIGIQWIERPYLSSAHLQNAYLYEAELRGANLSWARLQGANLSSARLQEADLSSAYLQGTDLSSAYLQGTDIIFAQLQGTNLWQAGLQGADLSSANLEGADLSLAQLQGADLSDAVLDFSMWHNAKFDTDKTSLKKKLKDAKLSKGKIKSVLKRFKKQGNRELWQPMSAQIFCNDDFAPLTYGNSITDNLNPNNEDIDWKQEVWEAILDTDNIETSSLFYAVRGFIDIHGREKNLCSKGLRLAIQSLDNYDTIYEKLPKRYQQWLKRPS